VARQDADAFPAHGEFASADCDIVQQVADVVQPFQDGTLSVTDVV
jgi:hypothetical protein